MSKKPSKPPAPKAPPWDFYKTEYNMILDRIANQVFLQLRHGQPVNVYFKPTDGKDWGCFDTRRSGQEPPPAPYVLFTKRPLYGNLTKEQMRYKFAELAANLPIIPT